MHAPWLDGQHLWKTHCISKNKISIWAEWLCQSGHATSEPSETHQLWITVRMASILHIMLNIALPSLGNYVFLFCRSPILYKHSGIEGHIWPWVEMGSMRTSLHRDYNTMGDAEKSTTHIGSTLGLKAILSLLNIHIIRSHQI